VKRRCNLVSGFLQMAKSGQRAESARADSTSITSRPDHFAVTVKRPAMICWPREATRRGAQIVCLPELFRSRYFCQREDASLFDLAEPVPGPTTVKYGGNTSCLELRFGEEDRLAPAERPSPPHVAGDADQCDRVGEQPAQPALPEEPDPRQDLHVGVSRVWNRPRGSAGLGRRRINRPPSCQTDTIAAAGHGSNLLEGAA
jgi:hypothetical protein